MKKSHHIYVLVVLVAIALTSCQQNQKVTNDTNQEWRLIYKNDKNGKHLYGSKEELLQMARKGYPIRVGWASRRARDTTKSVEHTSDATFVTIANGKELFTQITPFWAQRPDLNSDTLSMTLLPIKSSWILGTNGYISSVSEDHRKDTVASYPPSRFGYALNWFVKHPEKKPSSIDKDIPLWD